MKEVKKVMAMDDTRFPPPGKGIGRGSPSMAESPEGPGGLLRQLASRGAGPGMGGGEDAEAQSAQMVMQGAQILMQAAQLNPALVPIVQRAVEALRVGVQGMASGAGAGPPAPPQGGGTPPRRRRSRREEPPEGGEDEMV